MSTIQQVARELGMTSQEVIARLRAMGQPADSHLTPVDQSIADRLRRESGSSMSSDGNGALTATAPSAVATGDETATTTMEPADRAPAADEPSQDGAPPGGEPPDKETS